MRILQFAMFIFATFSCWQTFASTQDVPPWEVDTTVYDCRKHWSEYPIMHNQGTLFGIPIDPEIVYHSAAHCEYAMQCLGNTRLETRDLIITDKTGEWNHQGKKCWIGTTCGCENTGRIGD